jgi:hypothetical protein
LEFEEMTERLDQLLTSIINDEEFRTEVFGNKKAVPRVEVDALGMEFGEKKKRLHAHLQLKIHHQIGAYSIKKMRDRLKQVLDRYGQDITPGFHVHTAKNDRAGGAYQNYATKEARKANNIRVANDSSMSDEVERLSDALVLARIRDSPEDY